MKKLRNYVYVYVLLFVILMTAMPAKVSADTGKTKIITAIPTLFLGVHSKGFNPSSGNYARIQANVYIGSQKKTEAKLRIRVLNKDGKYVFQKTYSDMTTKFVDYKWNGKASKGNSAGVEAGTYVVDGTYKVELTLYTNNKTYKKRFQKTTKRKSLKVSRNAPAGTKGYYARKSLVRYTGEESIDYMAELMIRDAGVQLNMTKDEKVKRIYHYMTTHFKHTHKDEMPNRKVFYNLKSLEDEIMKYAKQCENELVAGRVLYTLKDSKMKKYMQKRGGECNHHADIFKILCNHVGVDAGVCHGKYVNRNGKRSNHFWNYAVLDNRIYYYDVDVEIQNYGGGQGDYYWYKKTMTQSKETHEYSEIQDR